MNKRISVLGGLLILQLVAAVMLNVGKEDYGAFEPQEKLLAVGDVTVDGLRIEDGENAVVLEKRDGHWVLPDLEGFPADQGAVERLVDRLAELDKGWPVATTAGAARRFRVDGKAFERRLALESGGETVAELLVGTSPGFRKVHVRPAGENAVFAVAFNTWEAGATADDWIDRDDLRIDADTVSRVELPGVVLRRDGSDLVVADLEEGEETDTQAARVMVERLASLRIESVLGAEAKPAYRQDEPELVVKVVRNDGETLTYRFSKPEEGADYVLKRSDRRRYFAIAGFTVEALVGAGRETLVVRPEAGDEAGGDGATDRRGEP